MPHQNPHHWWHYIIFHVTIKTRQKARVCAIKTPIIDGITYSFHDYQNQTESLRMRHQNPHHWWHYVLIPWLSNRQKACVCTIKTPIIDGITYSSHDQSKADRKPVYAPSKPPSLMALCTLPVTFYKPDRKLAYAFSKPPSLMALRTFSGYILNQTESAYVFSNPITKSKWPHCVLPFKTFIRILLNTGLFLDLRNHHCIHLAHSIAGCWSPFCYN